ncbi:hypothetical protein KFZ56_13910 [Virgibacillus sp. NKC19-3]|uniref:hypothetical protein n=1 Tax=Virgibacillus saliphilus TaxID=2831674 RepID=UPI001C9B298D|nr:hypothetical protein [Virgibacillus sp. NKC19-3]MBY7144123.1 hypothetical protein [Virgibacillus sp. NKC19-3]
MSEQEKYKNMLKKLIDETESHKIRSSKELVQSLVNELTHHTSGKTNSTTQTLAK